MNSNQEISRYLAQQTEKIDTLSKFFAEVEDEFEYVFNIDSDDDASQAFAHLRLFREKIYDQRRAQTDAAEFEAILAANGSLPALDNEIDRKYKSLRGWLSEMALSEHDPNDNLSFHNWQRVRSALKAYMAAQKLFLIRAIPINVPMHGQTDGPAN